MGNGAHSIFASAKSGVLAATLSIKKRYALWHTSFLWSKCGDHSATLRSVAARLKQASLLRLWATVRTPFSLARKVEFSRPHCDKGKSTPCGVLFPLWSKCGDSNSRPPVPETGALPTALHLVIFQICLSIIARFYGLVKSGFWPFPGLFRGYGSAAGEIIAFPYKWDLHFLWRNATMIVSNANIYG